MKRLIECGSVSEYLSTELARRRLRNKSYSMRAFARDLELSPSRLSEVLNGHEGLSEQSAERVAARLALKTKEREYFRDLVLATSARNRTVRKFATERMTELRELDKLKRLEENKFRLIADWYHGAILELTQTKGFRADSAWIAARLGITRSQAADAIARLDELGLIKIEANGKWSVPPEAVVSSSDIPSSAIRKFHRQVLAMAMESVIEDANEEREFQAMCVAIPKSRMNEFRREMQKFMTKFWHDIESDPDKTDLYYLAMQLFPVKNRRRSQTKENETL